MNALDPLRPASADSFDRAADLIRSSKPGRRHRGLAAAAALAALVGACATPVETDETIGTVVSWTVYGSADPGHYTVRALDSAVPAEKRVGLETRPAERPALPEGHPDSPAAGWTRIGYTTSETHPDSLAQIQRAARDVVGVYGLAVKPEVRARRVPFVAATARAVRRALQAGAPQAKERDLQAFIDAHLERIDLPEDSYWRMFPPRVERLPDGRRALVQDRVAIVLTSETRLWMRPGDAQRPIDAFGVGYDELLWRTADGWKSSTERGFPEPDAVGR